ncbi:HesA/MoeB/ThiF family protein [Clostridium brassicae]|uniref:HesA/MoeB/ThiF family protein n=1 Tax=Clostridium brassicae TaxID=2999072 RepID=A0ABT4D755_9CLOT|nr:HesA/MoeB/ThiF family protein [Clostridium brassicae]MCY6957528.1 HesA/MoeB/ThiF family protein [Clostridium brassicae]
MLKKYIRNMNTLTRKELELLKNYKVCVIGCGRIGGYVIDMLGKIGLGYMKVVDYDIFTKDNCNRKILYDGNSIGKYKSVEAAKRMKKINESVKVNPVVDEFNKRNAEKIIGNCNVVIDALNNINSRLILQDTCEKLNIPLVHGGIGEWYGEICTILPGDRTFNFIYNNYDDKENNNIDGVEKWKVSYSCIPSLIASIQVSEVIKLCVGKGELLRKKVLFIDLLGNEYNIIKLEKSS